MRSLLFAVLALVVTTTPTASAETTPTWQDALAEVKALEKLRHPAADVEGGGAWIGAEIARAEQAFAALVVALPDDSPDLPAAACELRGISRGQKELQLRRAMTVAAGRGATVEALYGSLRAQTFALDEGYDVKDGKLVRNPADAVRVVSPAPACEQADVATLRLQLAELYAAEVAGKSAGAPTSKRGQRNAALAEIDGLYRDVRALAASDAAVATLLDLASLDFCRTAKKPVRAAVCIGRRPSLDRALAIREAALPAGDLALAATRLAHARVLGNVKKTAGEGLAALNRVVLDAPVGSQPHLLALFDVYAAARGRQDTAQARQFEQLIRIDLALPAEQHTYTWAEVANRVAALARADGRDTDALATFAAAAKGGTTANPVCIDDDGCDARWFRIDMMTKQADLDPVNAATLRRDAEMLRTDLTKLRAARADEVRRRMGNETP